MKKLLQQIFGIIPSKQSNQNTITKNSTAEIQLGKSPDKVTSQMLSNASKIPPQKLENVGKKPSKLENATIPSKKLEDIKGNNRWICSIDGGGVRGIIALKALKAMQSLYLPNSDGSPKKMTEIFDMFAGTSTGSIIASLLADDVPIDNIISMYEDINFRKRVFNSNEFCQVEKFGNSEDEEGLGKSLSDLIFAKDLLLGLLVTIAVGGIIVTALSWGLLAPWVAGILITVGAVLVVVSSIILYLTKIKTNDRVSAAKETITPKYTKGIKKILNEKFGDRKLSDLKRDILISSRDTKRNETIYFSSFDPNRAPSVYNLQNMSVRGVYSDMKIRDAVEASMSAPIYFAPFDRFLDGGVGSYNNPAAAAAFEALLYSSAKYDSAGSLSFDPNDNLYKKGETVVWSFGTGQQTEVFKPDPNDYLKRYPLINEHRLDFWIKQVISQSFMDSNDQQVFLCERVLGKELTIERNIGGSITETRPWIEFKRYQIYINEEGLSGINMDSSIPNYLDPKTIGDITDLDAFEENKFYKVKNIADNFASQLIVNLPDNTFNQPIVEIGRPSSLKSIRQYHNEVITELNDPKQNYQGNGCEFDFYSY
jgi:patatin-like phospholipase/acyl hydrolase